ncbi:MAG: tyrosine-type recombinase/integrase [Candidatus Portnoybacteria bacterium]|nr:tyrosine-type recombinase/integrase [Candidatus Portnoybacteria bacterium]
MAEKNGQTKNPTPSLPRLDDFLLNLQTNNYSQETIYNYERDLNVFTRFLTESGFDFDKITKTTILNYKAYLISRDRKTAKENLGEKKLGSYSINRMLSSLRSYLRFLIEMDYRVPVPPESVKLMKTQKKHPQVAELPELIKLIEAPDQFEKNKLVALRNRTILEVLFSTGMRISEVTNLKKNQIDNTGRIFIIGKGKKERFVYLTQRAHEHLQNYLKTRNDTLPYLFIPYSGLNNTKKDKKISPNYLQERIKRYREYLGINVPTSAHSLRHGFATYLAEQGANPAAIQILLGHESLNTTTRYVHASDRYAEQTHRKFHPLKK